MKNPFARVASRIASRWQALPRKEQNGALLAIAIVILVVYLAVFWRESHNRRSAMEYELSKQNIRNRKAASAAPAGSKGKNEAADIRGNVSPLQLEQDLAKVEERLKEARTENERWQRAFVDLESTDVLRQIQQLKTGITQLAESGDMEVQRLEHVLSSEAERDKPPTAETLKDAAVKNIYRRPLLRFKARASYRGLMQFLHGLDTLPFVVAPVKSSIEVKTGEPPAERNAWLSVEFELAV